uniref:RRM domain-containing protein n=1 Tax=Panagrolaimus sp. JU765 TaxID=591449 RepID=A0AC34QZH7_9BILA
MNQDEVRALFASMGEIESCKLVRDKVTGQSLGYAFVNYTRQEDAKRAMSSLNGLRLQNKTIKVSYARPSNECIKGANLYVSGLPKSLTLKELKDIFHPYGKIITSRILFDNVTGISKGVGFVRFDKKSEAEYAIDKVNGTTPPGFTEALSVKFANSPGARDRAVLQQMASNLTTLGALTVPTVAPSQLTSQLAAAQAFLPLTTVLRTGGTQTAGLASAGGGPMRHTSQVARFRYSPLGVQPQTSLAMPQLTTSASDLFTTNALLQMAAAGNVSTQAQLAALAAGAQVAFPLTAAPTATQTAQAVPLSTSPSGGFTIVVANLGNEAEESLLWRLFGPYGAVLSVRAVKDTTDRGRSFGLVTMASYEDAFNAVNSLNGASMSGRTLQVSFKNANAALH